MQDSSGGRQACSSTTLLKARGSSLADAKRQFCERTIAGEWLRQLAPKTKPITHEDLLAYYKEHETEFDFPAQAKWEELSVQFSRMNGDRAAAWKAIAEMGNEVWLHSLAKSERARAGVHRDCQSEIARHHCGRQEAHTIGRPAAPCGARKSTKPFFLFEIGQLSDIIESETGFHIIRVLERKEAGRTPFTEAQADIAKILEAEGKKGPCRRSNSTNFATRVASGLSLMANFAAPISLHVGTATSKSNRFASC